MPLLWPPAKRNQVRTQPDTCSGDGGQRDAAAPDTTGFPPRLDHRQAVRRRGAVDAQSELFAGLIMRIAAGLLAVFMAVLVRLLSVELPIGEIVFGRSAVALSLIVGTHALRGRAWSAFATSRPLAQIVRGLTGTAAMALNFTALAYLSIAQAQSIMYTSPLFVLAISAAVLRHEVSSLCWAGVAVGFCGTALVLGVNPVSTALPSLLSAYIALAGAALTAAAMLQVRFLARTETTTSIATYFALTAAVASLATLPLGWIWPTPRQFLHLALLGGLGALAHLLLTKSLATTEPTLLASCEYLNVIWAICLGAVFFDERIGGLSLAGAALIIIAGVAVTSNLGRPRRTLNAASQN